MFQPGTFCGTKRGRKGTSSGIRWSYSHHKQFSSEEVSNLPIAGIEKLLLPVKLKERQRVQEKTVKLQCSNTHLPRTSQSTRQITQPQSLLLIKSSDFPEFSCSFVVFMFPSLEDCFPNCSLLEAESCFLLPWLKQLSWSSKNNEIIIISVTSIYKSMVTDATKHRYPLPGFRHEVMPPGIRQLMTSPHALNEQPHTKRSESLVRTLRCAELQIRQAVAARLLCIATTLHFKCQQGRNCF